MRLPALVLLVTLLSAPSLTARTDEARLAVTMRNQPRPGMAPAGDADPGTAIVRFTPEPGHRYEVEVRADAASFSRRVWTTGAWAPVVRDRTTDRVVSGDPEWAAPPCTPQAQ